MCEDCGMMKEQIQNLRKKIDALADHLKINFMFTPEKMEVLTEVEMEKKMKAAQPSMM